MQMALQIPMLSFTCHLVERSVTRQIDLALYRPHDMYNYVYLLYSPSILSILKEVLELSVRT